MEISSEQIARFREDGFMSVDGLLDEKGVEAARNAFDALFRSEFERGILPDEVNWKEGKSDPTLTRQICNGWKANTAIARIVLRDRRPGRLAGYPYPAKAWLGNPAPSVPTLAWLFINNQSAAND